MSKEKKTTTKESKVGRIVTLTVASTLSIAGLFAYYTYFIYQMGAENERQFHTQVVSEVERLTVKEDEPKK